MKLVKILLITLPMLAMTSAAFAQESYLDVLLNYNPTNFNYGDSNDLLKDYKKDVWGLQAGMSFQGGVTRHFSVLSEFYFIMKGGALKAGNPLTDTEMKTRLYSLEMPVMARLHFCGIFLNAGPTVTYNLAGRVKTGGSESEYSKMKFDGSEGAYKRFDAGVQFGGGYEFKIKNTRVAIDGRYHYGLVNIQPSGEKYNRYFNWNITFSRALKSNPLAKK